MPGNECVALEFDNLKENNAGNLIAGIVKSYFEEKQCCKRKSRHCF